MKPDVFDIWSRVRKVGGSYQANGTVVSAFKTLSGKQRYVFEFDEFSGMLHIFNHEQLEPLNNESPECPRSPGLQAGEDVNLELRIKSFNAP